MFHLGADAIETAAAVWEAQPCEVKCVGAGESWPAQGGCCLEAAAGVSGTRGTRRKQSLAHESGCVLRTSTGLNIDPDETDVVVDGASSLCEPPNDCNIQP
jgi:hypothetical protein